MNLLELFIRYKGMVQLEGTYSCTTNTTRQYDKVVSHTRNENRGFVIYNPHVSSKKASLNLVGLDTTTRKEDKSYSYRALVLSINFDLRHNLKVNRGGWEEVTMESLDSIFPVIPLNCVEEFLTYLGQVKVLQDFIQKAKNQLPKKRESSEEGREETFRVETSYQFWGINVPVSIPRYSWKSMGTSYNIMREIIKAKKKISQIKNEIIQKTGLSYLTEFNDIEFIRAIELGIIEKGLLVALNKGDMIICKNDVEVTYVTKKEFEEILLNGAMIEDHCKKDGTIGKKAIVGNKVPAVGIPKYVTV